MCGVVLILLPRLKMCNLNPTETSTCRRCQSDSGSASLSSGLPHLLACDPRTHTCRGEPGICPLPPSPPVLCLASFHPSAPPSLLCPLMSGVQPEVMDEIQSSHVVTNFRSQTTTFANFYLHPPPAMRKQLVSFPGPLFWFRVISDRAVSAGHV